jgi:predicted NAD/FAD-dependent oxidoreductase
VLWDLFSVSSLNVPGDDASLALAAVVVKTGLLGDADAADIGVPTLPLGELHGTAAARVLGKLGATVRLQAKVAAIEPTDGGEFHVKLARSDDEADAAGETTDLVADAVVLAVPHEQAAKLIPAGALPAETIGGWAGLGAAPIVNVHVIYDRKVMDVPFAAAVDSPVQWVFDRTRISGMHARGDAGQYLAISLSAADEYASTPVADLREKFVPALAKLFPAAKDATVTEFFVTREKRATFRQVPGTAKLRPKAATGLPGLVLAGSWTDTGWPDTMEGAVRSGLNAVIALFSSGGRPPVPPDVRAGRPDRKNRDLIGPASADQSSGGTADGGEASPQGTNSQGSELAENAGTEVKTEEADEREVRS